MNTTKPQCKDIPDVPILKFLLEKNGWCNWFENQENSVRNAMPLDTPDRLVLAKMRSLIKRGLVEGCGCGCRGDFEITNKGKESIS